jgi:hypothetical protein
MASVLSASKMLGETISEVFGSFANSSAFESSRT